MKIEQVKAVVEIYRCAALHGHSATPEQIHKLMLLSARIWRLHHYRMAEMSVRQTRAYERAWAAMRVIGAEVGAKEVTERMYYGGLVIKWDKCPDTLLIGKPIPEGE